MVMRARQGICGSTAPGHFGNARSYIQGGLTMQGSHAADGFPADSAIGLDEPTVAGPARPHFNS